MNQELLMDFVEDLKEVIQKGEQLMQEMQGGSFGQRGGGYGMRSGSYNNRSGYGNRGGYGRRGADIGHQIGASQQMGGGDPYSQMPPPYYEQYGQMGPDPRMM